MEELKAAEQRGYSRGYAAGRKREARVNIAQDRDAYWRRLFAAALPPSVEVQGWARGKNPITSLDDRIRLAGDFADAALSEALRRNRI
jgi:hypothetical protein